MTNCLVIQYKSKKQLVRALKFHLSVYGEIEDGVEKSEDFDIREVRIPGWVKKELADNGIKTVKEVQKLTREEFLALEGLGDAALHYVNAYLAEMDEPIVE